MGRLRGTRARRSSSWSTAGRAGGSAKGWPTSSPRWPTWCGGPRSSRGRAGLCGAGGPADGRPAARTAPTASTARPGSRPTTGCCVTPGSSPGTRASTPDRSTTSYGAGPAGRAVTRRVTDAHWAHGIAAPSRRVRGPDLRPRPWWAASVPYPVAHFATFPLPEDVGDFGGGAVTLMRPDDIFVVLFEYGPESLGTALFARQGMPRSLSTDDFRPYRAPAGARRPVGDPVVLHRVGSSVHLLRRPREPRPPRRPGPEGEQPARSVIGVTAGGRAPATGRRRGTDRPLPGGLRPAGGGRRGQGGAARTTRPGPWCAGRSARVAGSTPAWPAGPRSEAPSPRPLLGAGGTGRSPGPATAAAVAVSYCVFAVFVVLATGQGRCPGQLRVLRHARTPRHRRPRGGQPGPGRRRGRGGRPPADVGDAVAVLARQPLARRAPGGWLSVLGTWLALAAGAGRRPGGRSRRSAGRSGTPETAHRAVMASAPWSSGRRASSSPRLSPAQLHQPVRLRRQRRGRRRRARPGARPGTAYGAGVHLWQQQLRLWIHLLRRLHRVLLLGQRRVQLLPDRHGDGRVVEGGQLLLLRWPPLLHGLQRHLPVRHRVR